MKIVFLDTKTIGDDIDLSHFSKLGPVTKYDFSTEDEARERTQDADVIIINKVNINPYTIGNATHLKLVCVTATGTNNLDKEYLESRGIPWRNVAGYSTDSVTQHTFAMLLYLYENLSYYDDYVKSGHYVNDVIFTHFSQTFKELKGKTFGIIGLGNIGRSVYHVAQAFGLKTIYASPSGATPQDGYNQVEMETIFKESDILSIHAPLTPATENLINKETLAQMKPTAILLNLARGTIINEEDLADALESGVIAAAGLDVLRVEPMAADNPLLRIKDSKKLLITPHIGWASVEARTRLMDMIHGQIKDFFEN